MKPSGPELSLLGGFDYSFRLLSHYWYVSEFLFLYDSALVSYTFLEILSISFGLSNVLVYNYSTINSLMIICISIVSVQFSLV